jgi:hypothetical protein
VCPNDTCQGDATLFTEKGATDTYDPMGQIKLQYGPLLQRVERPNGYVAYDGDYPDVCASYNWWGDRSDNGELTLKRSGKTWVRGSCESTSREEPLPPRPPRALDDALLHAPVPGAVTRMVHGAGSPPMLIEEDALYLWDGKAWAKRDPPWASGELAPLVVNDKRPPRGVRLAGGGTLLARGRGYFIDAQGSAARLDFVDGDAPIDASARVAASVWTKKGPWLAVRGKDSELFLSADEAERARFVRAEVPARAGVRPAPPPPPRNQGADAGAVDAGEPPDEAAAALADAGTSDLPAPVAYTPACAAPFVLLATPPKAGQSYALTREGLRGNGALQDVVTFVEFVREGRAYFGAQAKTEADARALMAAVEKGVKGMKPQLACLDALSHIPDRYAPPPGARVVPINLATGELVPLD